MHLQRIIKAVDFIERHLNDAFSLTDVSRAAFSSLSYMHRIFYQMTGFTMKEYIRKRRLSNAALQLAQGRDTVLSISLGAGFDSAESFTRAFKQQFGVSPRAHRQGQTELTLVGPFDAVAAFAAAADDVMDFELKLEPVHYRSKHLHGYQTHTTLDGGQQIVDICAFSNRIIDSGVLSLHFDLSQTPVFGVYTNMTDRSEFDYTIACLSDSMKQPDTDLVQHVIDDGLYAKFTLNRLDRIKQAWHYIYGRWFPSIEDVRNEGLDFETYHDDHACIYIPMTAMPTKNSSALPPW